jgi:trimeric autotransporter adhesin
MYSRKWLLVALVMCGLASACSDYNTNLSIQTSSSVLTFVSPSTATVGSQGFTITANGSGFITGAVILWNGTALTTTLVSASQLTAPVPASDLATAGTAKVSVQIPGSAQSATQNVNNTTTTEISNVVLFTIGAAAGTPPTVTSLSASTTSAASTPYCSAQGFTLSVSGTNFTSDAVIHWNGAPQPSTFVSATQITAAIPASLAAFPGTATVTVTNSNGTSGSLPFTLSTPGAALAAPTIATLSQSSAAAGSAAVTLTVTGTNLLPCSTVQWTNTTSVKSTLATTFVSATQLTATIPVGDFLAIGAAQVAVVTQSPGGGTSSGLPFTIVAPAVSSVSASTTASNSTPSCSLAGFTLSVTGTNFVNGSVVEWNGSPRTTTFVSATQITAAISASDIAAAGAASITVSNVGVLSNAVPFTISTATLPAATISSISPVGATAGTAAFPLIITGTNFVPCSSAQWVDTSSNVTQLTTAYVSPTQLSVSVSAANLNTVQTAQLSVANPAASANTSNAIAFPIVLPTITSLSGSTTSNNTTPACSTDVITLTVNGTNFVSNGLVVNWNGSPRPTTFVSATQLTAVISAVDTAFPGPATITVSSATFPSLASASAPFTIVPSPTPLPTPVIGTLLPSSTQAGSAAFLLGVDATSATAGNLVPCSTVLWNGSARTTTFTSPTGVNAAIASGDVAAAAVVPVTVSTPTDGGGGGTSNAVTFTVFNPPPAVRVIPLVESTATLSTASAGAISLPAPTMSADKRYAVIVLASADGVNEVPGALKNIFVRDTCAGAPSGCSPSVSIASAGINSSAADGDSISPSISADGRYVTFLSSAMNLVDSDTNGVADVFIRDTCAGAPSGCRPSMQRVSIAAAGTQANGASTAATISATGRYITFQSAATNLTSTGASGLFLRDTCTGADATCSPTTQLLQ